MKYFIYLIASGLLFSCSIDSAKMDWGSGYNYKNSFSDSHKGMIDYKCDVLLKHPRRPHKNLHYTVILKETISETDTKKTLSETSYKCIGLEYDSSLLVIFSGREKSDLYEKKEKLYFNIGDTLVIIHWIAKKSYTIEWKKYTYSFLENKKEIIERMK